MTPEYSQLLRRHDVPGPRYTSYPTVPYWTETPTADAWLESLANPAEAGRGAGAAIYVHVPFCESLCTYCGCNTRITRNRSLAPPYVDLVLKEWAMYRDRLSPGNGLRLAELHLGGGTPTYLEPSDLGRLVGGILSGTTLAPNHELSIEADPRVTRREHLEVLREHGFTRLSLGIQDFDPTVQKAVNRTQSEELVRRVVDEARGLGFTGVNFDLIYGLPFQTEQSIRDTLSAVSRLRPDRLAFYAYAHVPWIKPWQRSFTEDDLPVGEAKRHLYEVGRDLLAEHGFRDVGMDHFALETDSLWKAAGNGSLHRNFMGYTARPVFPLIGLGVSSIGDSWRAFAQNEKSVETYGRKIMAGELPIHRGHVLNDEDLVLRRHILNVMTRFGTSWTEADARTPFLETVPARLAPLADDGIVELRGDGLSVTPLGRAFLRNVCMALDARLARKDPGERLFSRAV